MMITDSMSDQLSKIVKRAPKTGKLVRGGSLTDEQIAQELIELYRKTEDLDIRQSIMEFMTDAGYVWLRKLFTRDDMADLVAA